MATKHNITAPSPGFLGKITARVSKEERFLAIKKMVFFLIGTIASLIAIFPAFNAVYRDTVNSGLIQFSSLMFSDTGTVITYWNDFCLSVLESLPVLSMTIFLGIIFIFLESVKFSVRNANKVFKNYGIINH